MSTEASEWLFAALIGVGATALLDLWSLFLNRAFKVPLSNFCLVGRWFSHMTEGRFRHASIATASQMPSECAVGWIAHYVIGALYGLAFVALASGGWLSQPTLLPALIFGVLTVLLPFLHHATRIRARLRGDPERRIRGRRDCARSCRTPFSAWACTSVRLASTACCRIRTRCRH